MTAAADVTVRPCEDRDRARLAEVADRAFSRTERVSFDPGKGHTLVAETDGEVIGGAVLRHVDVAGHRVGFTDWIFADPEQAAPGTGSMLRDAAVEWFDELGTDETIARIDAANTRHPAGRDHVRAAGPGALRPGLRQQRPGRPRSLRRLVGGARGARGGTDGPRRRRLGRLTGPNGAGTYPRPPAASGSGPNRSKVSSVSGPRSTSRSPSNA